MTSLDIIGCGRAGRAMARLWAGAGVFEVRDVLNRSGESAAEAAAFLGTGRPVSSLSELEPADAVMISTPDNAIARCCEDFVREGEVGGCGLVFHLSGSFDSGILSPARRAGAAVASVHPVRSFADPAAAAASFPGTCCALEGDAAAISILRPALEAIGGRVIVLDAGAKPLFHAAAVFASNYAVALAELAFRLCKEAGISQEEAMPALEPLMRGSVENIFRLGPATALTGPVARGEVEVVRRHLEELCRIPGNSALLYRELGKIALELARARKDASPDDLCALEKIFCSKDTTPAMRFGADGRGR